MSHILAALQRRMQGREAAGGAARSAARQPASPARPTQGVVMRMTPHSTAAPWHDSAAPLGQTPLHGAPLGQVPLPGPHFALGLLPEIDVFPGGCDTPATLPTIPGAPGAAPAQLPAAPLQAKPIARFDEAEPRVPRRKKRKRNAQPPAAPSTPAAPPLPDDPHLGVPAHQPLPEGMAPIVPHEGPQAFPRVVVDGGWINLEAYREATFAPPPDKVFVRLAADGVLADEAVDEAIDETVDKTIDEVASATSEETTVAEATVAETAAGENTAGETVVEAKEEPAPGAASVAEHAIAQPADDIALPVAVEPPRGTALVAPVVAPPETPSATPSATPSNAPSKTSPLNVRFQEIAARARIRATPLERDVATTLADSQRAAPYRELLANLRAALPTPPRTSVVLLTAPRRDEATGEVLLHLATLLAGEGGRVLLVDGMGDEASLSHRLEAGPGRGWTDIVAGVATLAAVAQPLAADRVSLLPYGAGGERLGAEVRRELAAVLAAARGEYPYILVDAPPELAAGPPARQADATLLLVRLEADWADDAWTTAHDVTAAGGRLAGCVVSRGPSADVEAARPAA